MHHTPNAQNSSELAGRNGPRWRRSARRSGTSGRRSVAIGVCVALAAAVMPITSGSLSTATPVAAAPVGQGFNLNVSDVRFILDQIKIAENHAAAATVEMPNPPCDIMLGDGPDQIPNGNGQGILLPFGLRTVDGSCNNLITGREDFGAADQTFPRLLTPDFRDAQDFDPDGPGPTPPTPTSYDQTSGIVSDTEPRVASNLIVDQSIDNPAAVAAADGNAVPDATGTLFIPNEAPDVGLSAPYNSWFTLFGQFFDHGLDLVDKSGGTVIVPLEPDDELFAGSGQTPFMLLTRAKNQPGPDGVVGDDPATVGVDESLDDVKEATNRTTPFVDQNQTYTSHPAHQVFLREYAADVNGLPAPTGRLLDGASGGMSTWGDVKAQASSLLGIQLTDTDVLNVPVIATDPYGRFLPGPNGFPQLVLADGDTIEGDPTANAGAGVAIPENVERTNHQFLVDIAHHAVPTPGAVPDADPGTTDDGDPATYDDEMLAAHFMAGDGRANENIGLTAIHTVFHSEHNRLVQHVKDVVTNEDPAMLFEWQDATTADGWNGQRLFQAARFVTEMEYQHLVFEEFGRRVQPQINVFSGYDADIDPAIMAEFAHTVYRFGHSLLTETVSRTDAAGNSDDISLFDAFLNPPAFLQGGTYDPEQAVGSIARGMTRQVGNELDEFVTDALRNRLVGLPLDLATLNLARGRDTGIPRLNAARRGFHAATNSNSLLTPYDSWFDYGLSLRNHESLINFVAAYGTHPTVTSATTNDARRAAAELLVAADLSNPATPADAEDFFFGSGPWANQANGVTITGVDDIDFWVGGMAEAPEPFGGLLGSTFNFVFETQLENLQDGDRFYYLTRTAGLNMLTQLEGNSFAELIERNSDAAGLPADVFARPDFIFNLDDPEFQPGGTLPADVVRLADGTIRYTGDAHVVLNGTAGADGIHSSEGDDTVRGNDGDDRLEGGAGNDGFIGGLGNDIITDTFGDDDLKGGDGNDAINSGNGFDLSQGGRGDDFLVGGSDPVETLAGPGDDIIFGGDSADTVFGDDGDDWIEGGNQADLLQGDNGAPFQDDPNEPGNDVIDGGGGNDDYDAEGGDDIMISGTGIERNEGMRGFDWVTHRGDVLPAEADMTRTGLLPPTVEDLSDRFDLVEGLSGWDHDDVLRGDDADAVSMAPDHVLDAAGIARIAGLAELLPAGTTSFAAGNIIIGGSGSDLIEGRGGDDIIDGDAYLDVWLRSPDPATSDPSDTKTVYTLKDLQADVFAGLIDPGAIVIERSIVTPPPSTSVDTAVYSDVLASYDIDLDVVDGLDVIEVTHARGTVTDGTDTLTRIERLAFADQTIAVADIPANTPASGTLDIDDLAPVEDGLLTVVPTIIDPDGFVLADVVLTWQAELAPGVWTSVATGTTFTPGDAVVNAPLRVVATFVDGDGVNESVTSLPTAPVANVNDEPVGVPALTDPRPRVGSAVLAATDALSDDDGLLGAVMTFQWTANRVPIPGATEPVFVPTNAQIGTRLRVEVTFTDDHGTTETLESARTNRVRGQLPGAPTIGVAVAGDTSATLNWMAPAEAGSSPITEYRIQVRSGGAVVRTITAIAPSAISHVIDGLTNGTRYRFRVRAVSAVGNSPWSAASNAVRPADRVRPTLTRATPLDGAIGVGRNTNIVIRFDEPVVGVDATTFWLRNDTTGARVTGVVTLRPNGNYRLDPDVRLPRGTTFTVRVQGGRTGVTDVAGNRFRTVTWQFTTR